MDVYIKNSTLNILNDDIISVLKQLKGNAEIEQSQFEKVLDRAEFNNEKCDTKLLWAALSEFVNSINQTFIGESLYSRYDSETDPVIKNKINHLIDSFNEFLYFNHLEQEFDEYFADKEV